MGTRQHSVESKIPAPRTGRNSYTQIAARTRHRRGGFVDSGSLQRECGCEPSTARAFESFPIVTAHGSTTATIGAVQPAIESSLLQLGAHPTQGLNEDVLAAGRAVARLVFGYVLSSCKHTAALFAAQTRSCGVKLFGLFILKTQA